MIARGEKSHALIAIIAQADGNYFARHNAGCKRAIVGILSHCLLRAVSHQFSLYLNFRQRTGLVNESTCHFIALQVTEIG